MPKTRVRFTLGPFTGGLNEDDAPTGLAAEDLRIARNVYWEGDALASRRGSSRITTDPITPISTPEGTGIWQFERNFGATLDTLAVFGNALYKNADQVLPTDITGSATITFGGVGTPNIVTFRHFNDLAIMCNAVDTPWKWSGSGSAAVLGGSPPAFRTMAGKWNRMFGAGHTAAKRTIRYSDRGDPETWAAGNTVAAVLGDSSSAIEGRDWIWQLDHLGDSLFVGLHNSIGRVLFTGDSTTLFRYVQLAEFGIEGPRAYVPVGPDGYFLTRRGVHLIRPTDVQITYESSLVSGRRLRQLFQDMALNRLQYTTGVLYRTSRGNLIVVWPITLGSDTKHNAILLMDVTAGVGKERFAIWTGWNVTSLGISLTSARAERLLFTSHDSTGGYVWQGDTGTNDNGSAYIAEAATRWEDFDAPSEKKNFRDLYVEAKQTGAFDLSIDVLFDYKTVATGTLTMSLTGSGQALWGTAVWGTDLWATLGFTQGYLLGVDDGATMSFRFYTTAANRPWAIYKVIPAVEAIGESRED